MVLRSLSDGGLLPPAEISSEIGISTDRVRDALCHAYKDKLVTRTRDEETNGVLYKITPKGCDLLDLYNSNRRKEEDAALKEQEAANEEQELAAISDAVQTDEVEQEPSIEGFPPDAPIDEPKTHKDIYIVVSGGLPLMDLFDTFYEARKSCIIETERTGNVATAYKLVFAGQSYSTISFSEY